MRIPFAAFLATSFLSVTCCVSADDIDFNRDVRPILPDRCFFCHGPDTSTQEAELRLDSRAAAAEVINSGELLNRVLSEDADLRMPPVDSKLSLSEDDKQVLRAWVKQGAKYQEHWAFEPLPTAVDVPDTENIDRSKNELDHFVLAKLDEIQLDPAPKADSAKLVSIMDMELQNSLFNR